MAFNGFEEYWLAGGKLLFQPDGTTDCINLGVMSAGSLTPNINTENIELYDNDGGSRKLVDEANSTTSETYELTLFNLNMRNWSIFYLAGAEVSDWTQSVFTPNPTPFVGKKNTHLRLLSQDGKGAVRTRPIALMLANPTPVPFAVTAINGSTLTVNGAGSLTPGSALVLAGAGLQFGDAKVVTVQSANASQVVVNESFSQNYPTLSGQNLFFAALSTQWAATQFEQDRGYVRILNGLEPAFVGENCIFYSQEEAVDDGQQILPLDNTKPVTGKAWLYMSRGGNYERETMRECRASLTPNGGSIAVEDYSSLNLTMKVLTDPTDVNPNGVFRMFKGGRAQILS